MMQLLCLSPHLLVILTHTRVLWQRNATSLVAREAFRWEEGKKKSVKWLQARGGPSRCFCFTQTNFVSSLMPFVLLISTNKRWRAKSNEWWGWGWRDGGAAAADGRSRDVVLGKGGRKREKKNVGRKETGLELCRVYGATSFHTAPSFMLLSQWLLQSTVALLQINSSIGWVCLSAARSIFPIHNLNTC